MSRKNDYDAIIIGAGISGLVCGCYLAKAGMKTLIIEKNAKPGGYCTSFTRGGFHFDACVHTLSSLRDGGNVRTVLKELQIEERLQIRRHDPSDIIFSPDCKINFWNDYDKTIKEFQNIFTGEAKGIKDFFDYINNCDGVSFSKLRNITFQELLERFFKDEKLLSVLSLPLLGNAGLTARHISAITGVLVYKEFIMDGGYYPSGSIQNYADTLAFRFKEFGGEIFLSSEVKNINVEQGKATGVTLMKKGYLSANYIISNADATQTYLSLIGEKFLSEKIVSLLRNTEPSLSAFVVYLGMDGNLDNMPADSVIWYLPHYDVDMIYNNTVSGHIEELDWFLARLSSDRKNIIMLVNVPFKTKEYWEFNKESLMDLFIKKMERIIPGLSSHILYKDAATPYTLLKWTSNLNGAAYGWARTPSQFAVKGFSQTTEIHNLFLTGHWTTLAQGVSGVTYLGRSTALLILGRNNLLKEV